MVILKLLPLGSNYKCKLIILKESLLIIMHKLLYVVRKKGMIGSIEIPISLIWKSRQLYLITVFFFLNGICLHTKWVLFLKKTPTHQHSTPPPKKPQNNPQPFPVYYTCYISVMTIHQTALISTVCDKDNTKRDQPNWKKESVWRKWNEIIKNTDFFSHSKIQNVYDDGELQKHNHTIFSKC